MLNTLDRFYIGAKIRKAEIAEQFQKDATGDSTIEATGLLIQIVVLLAAVFWDKISQWFNDTWDKIMEQNDTIK